MQGRGQEVGRPIGGGDEQRGLDEEMKRREGEEMKNAESQMQKAE